MSSRYSPGWPRNVENVLNQSANPTGSPPTSATAASAAGRGPKQMPAEVVGRRPGVLFQLFIDGQLADQVHQQLGIVGPGRPDRKAGRMTVLRRSAAPDPGDSSVLSVIGIALAAQLDSFLDRRLDIELDRQVRPGHPELARYPPW